MNPNRVTNRDKDSWRAFIPVHVTVATIVACAILVAGCAPDTDTQASAGDKASPPVGGSAPSTTQLTPDENRAKAMEAIDSNPNMTPEQKAEAKKRFESMGKKP